MEKPARRIRGPMRVIAPIAISAALHSGALFGIPAVRSWIQERQASALSSKEPLHDTIRNIDRVTLERLKHEKKEYVSSLLDSLRKGKSIRLSEFYIQSEVLDANIYRAGEGKPLLNMQQYLDRYNSLVFRAKKYVAGKPDKLRGTYDFFHEVYSRGYDPKKPGMLDILDTEWGNCNSSTLLFSSLVQDVAGVPQRILLFDDHIASFIRGRVIENTANLWAESNKPYDGCGAILPMEIMVAAYITNSGVEVDSLSRGLQKHYKQNRKWEKGCLARQPKSNPDFAAGAGGFPLLGVDSGFTVPEYPIPNVRRKIAKEPLTTEDLLAYAKAIRLAHALSQQRGERESKWQAVVPVELPHGLDWEQFLDRTKGWSIFSRIITFYPKEHRCSNKVYSTDDLEVLSIMRSFPKYKGTDLRKKLCSKYSSHVLKASPADLVKDFPYGFCRDERKVIMERYLSERWHELPVPPEINSLYLNLGFRNMGEHFLALLSNYARPEDFGFFMREFETRQDEDLRNYASYGMINADFERACNGVLRDAKSFSDKIGSITISCHNEEAIWSRFQDSPKEDIRELTFIRGAYITEEQAKLLESFGEKLSSEEKKPVALLKVARILAEYSDSLGPSNFNKYHYSLLANQFSTKSAEMISKGGSNLDFLEFHPSHFIHFKKIMEEGQYLGKFSPMAACVVAREQFPEETIELLKAAFASEEGKSMNRIAVAVVLLDLGINPLE